jgi:hypothetical protein
MRGETQGVAQQRRLSHFRFQSEGKRKMARRKYKTVAGYLRAMENDLGYKQEMARLHGKPVISVEDGQRQIINNFFVFLSIKDRVGPTEKPLDAIKRMRAAAVTDKQKADLDTCLKWLAQEPGRLEFVGVTVATA